MTAVFMLACVAVLIADRCAVASDRMDAFLAVEAARAERDNERRTQ